MPPPPAASAVSLTDLAIAFGLAGGGRYTAVEAIELAVRPGEFVAIVGPTGCGKSTLLNAAAGLLRPSAGKVEIFGAALSGLNGRAGYLFQQDALMPWKTALDNVAVALEPKGVRASRGAASGPGTGSPGSGSAAFVDRYPHMLSGGQRKRVALAQVLIRDPEILLMDEPFGPLDAQTRQIMGNLLLDLWAADRKAVMFVTHDLEEAIALADRVVVMSAGPAAHASSATSRSTLPRPRDIAEVRLEPAFHHIHKEIWASLQVEVQKAYAPGEVGVMPRQTARPADRRRPRHPSAAWHVLTVYPILGATKQVQFFFSTPLDVLARAWKLFASGEIWRHLWITLIETILAFAIGAGGGILFGFLFARRRDCSPPCSTPTSRPRTRCRAWCSRRSSRCGSASASGRRWRSASRSCSSSCSSTSTRACARCRRWCSPTPACSA